MSTTWWSMNKRLFLGSIGEANDNLNASRAWEDEGTVQPIKVIKDLMDDSFWLQRTDMTGQLHALEILDFDERRGSWTEMKRWGMNGANGTGEAILRPLVDLGFKIISEHNEQHYISRAREEELNLRTANDHNKLKHSKKEDRIRAGIK